MPMVGAFFPKDFSHKAHVSMKEAQATFIAEHVPDDIQTQSVIGDGSPQETASAVSFFGALY